MDVILLQRVEKLGQMGDVVKGKPGYGRNYLLPKGKAVRATADKLGEFKARQVHLEAVNLTQRKEAETVAEKIKDLSIIVIRSASEGGHLYGSIRPLDITQGAAEQGFTLHRSQVILEHPIKTLGLHKVKIALHPEVSTHIQVNIALTQEEALAQAQTASQGQNQTQASTPASVETESTHDNA